MTGGVGHDQLKRFYKYHFIGANPPDTELMPISRTVGTDQIVDELLFCFTHTSEIDWMLPGIAPTGRRVEIPLVAIVRFQDGKVAHEHIYWDQASVLVQIGKLDPDGLAGRGHRNGAQGRRQDVTQQHADDALVHQREQAALNRPEFTKLNQTPTFFVNAKPLPSFGPEELATLVKEEVEKSRLNVANQ